MGWFWATVFAALAWGIMLTGDADAKDQSPARRIEAWEGYGAQCAMAYNPRSDLGAAGSTALSCAWGYPYRGPWRLMGAEVTDAEI